MKAKILSLFMALVLALPLGLSSSASANDGPTPEEQNIALICEQLAPFFVMAYQLYKGGAPEAITLDIVAYHPDLDEWVAYPVYLGIRALYMAETPPRFYPYMYATQQGCLQTLGVDTRPARTDGRQDEELVYRNPRKDA